MKRVTQKRRRGWRVWMGLLVLLVMELPAKAKVDVDFDPNLEFARFKTYAYIGGVEHLVMLQLNPDLINERVHRALQREMARKGLREVQPNQNPDLVVRYTGPTAIRS